MDQQQKIWEDYSLLKSIYHNFVFQTVVFGVKSWIQLPGTARTDSFSLLTFIQRGCIIFVKSDSKDISIVTKKCI